MSDTTPERPETEAPVETESELDDTTQEHDTASAAAESEGEPQTSPNRRQGQDDDAAPAADEGDAAAPGESE